jgi:hypothetical protein
MRTGNRVQAPAHVSALVSKGVITVVITADDQNPFRQIFLFETDGPPAFGKFRRPAHIDFYRSAGKGPTTVICRRFGGRDPQDSLKKSAFKAYRFHGVISFKEFSCARAERMS